MSEKALFEAAFLAGLNNERAVHVAIGWTAD